MSDESFIIFKKAVTEEKYGVLGMRWGTHQEGGRDVANHIYTTKPIDSNTLNTRFHFDQPGVSGQAISELISSGRTKKIMAESDKKKIIDMPIDNLASKLGTNTAEARKLKDLISRQK